MLKLKEFVLASNNPHKAEEFYRLFTGFTILVSSYLGIEFVYEEHGESFLENAYGKAVSLYSVIQRPILSDDSGLVVVALGGEPGIYSSRYGSGEKGRKLSDKERNEYLLDRVQDLQDRRCYFVCCMVLYQEENRFLIAQETVHGELADRPSGSRGFGYDPIFYLPEYKKTIAELPDREKDKISHRGKAARRILDLINRG